MNRGPTLLVAVASAAVACVSHAQTNPVIENIGGAVELRWSTSSGGHYVIQTTTNLVSGTWEGLPPMVIGNGAEKRSAVLPPTNAPSFYRVLTVANTYCNEGHPAVGYWRGTAFADHYYFLPDGVVTGSVYQWKFAGTWLPTDASGNVFAIYRKDDHAPVHGANMPNPMFGRVNGTNMHFTVDGVVWSNYAYRVP